MPVRRRLALGFVVILLPIALFLAVSTMSSSGDGPGDASRYPSCC